MRESTVKERWEMRDKVKKDKKRPEEGGRTPRGELRGDTREIMTEKEGSHG